jgi:nucleotide-binding universal stress UspA family protein
MNILVPTDFSENAENAFRYAQAVVKDLGGEITLINVVHMQGLPSATFGIGKLMEMVEETIRMESHKALDASIEKADKSLLIRKHVELTYNIQECLKKFIQLEKFDLVIAGTKGASGLKKVFIGSNAAGMIDNLPVPIIVVPKEAQYKDHAHIAYVTDLIGEEKDFPEVIRLSRLFKAHTGILHVDTSGKANEEEIRVLFDTLAGQHHYRDYSITVIREKDILSGIDNFLLSHPSDFLCVAPEKRSIFGRFFDRSLSKELAYQSTLPVLAIKP